MLGNATALASGVLFGLGLIVSGMANPAKVLGFLDVFGDWDPSLALVMAAAVAIMAVAYGVKRPDAVVQPGQTVDRRLVLGAAIFGVGWGLVGYCPGPAIVGASLGA